jgi:NAD(P)-dependent dehydrogenase (short-subunit alcohol dehydrogenase family)
MSAKHALDGKVVIVTGAGGGVGEGIAKLAASQGAKVLVNDLGGNSSGEGADATPAQRVVDEIIAAGGEAAPSFHSIATWDGAHAIVQDALDETAEAVTDELSFEIKAKGEVPPRPRRVTVSGPDGPLTVAETAVDPGSEPEIVPLLGSQVKAPGDEKTVNVPFALTTDPSVVPENLVTLPSRCST